MQLTIFTVFSILLMLPVIIEARDRHIDDDAYETEKVSYCPRYEKWWKCGTGCERSCTNPNQPTLKNCKRPCIPHVCSCIKGRFRDNQGTGRCVPFRDCKVWGPEAEENKRKQLKEMREMRGGRKQNN